MDKQLVIMLGTSDSVPEYYKTPLLIQIVLTPPILFIVGADIVIFTRSTISKTFQNKKNRFSAPGTSMAVCDIVLK